MKTTNCDVLNAAFKAEGIYILVCISRWWGWEQVRGMEHRQKREMADEEQRRARQAELDAIEREAAAKARLEEEAFEQQLQACACSCRPCAQYPTMH